jgi:hypothetical protein
MQTHQVWRRVGFGVLAWIVLLGSQGHCGDVPRATMAGAQRADAPVEHAADAGPKSSAADAAPAPQIEGGQVNGRWREGSRLVDRSGSFKLAGDRVTFVSSDGKLKFDGLENLAIERIARTIADSPDPLEWSISGLITEYRGANYLLVTQAVLKTKAGRVRRAP